ncbi:MAG: GNAT family N-acetyltransferase [Bacteroidetes bacterium]|nr:GNAT family N-acetyltransferase [Bacteroidota bacterium]
MLFPATQPDLPTIINLANEIWNDHYISIIGQQQVDYMLEKMYSIPALQKQIEDGHSFYLIKPKEEIIGFVSVSISANEEALTLHKIYIKSGEQGSGIGSGVLDEIFDLYPKASSISLTVNRQNFKSINFYFKNGFTILKVADFDIGGGYFMNDFIMVRLVG